LYPAPNANVAHPEPHEVAASQLAIDGKIEKRKVTSTPLKLEADADRPDLLRFERTFLAGETAFIPGSLGKTNERRDRGMHGCVLDPDRTHRSAAHPLARATQSIEACSVLGKQTLGTEVWQRADLPLMSHSRPRQRTATLGETPPFVATATAWSARNDSSA
jgi:hypothetical protein